MQTITNQSQTKRAWAKAIAQPGQEFPLTPLPVLSGKIPAGLRGTLYRNGSARLERGGEMVGHWFDGDGAVLAVHFADEGASAVYRYVKTPEYIAESEAGKFLYSSYGMRPPGPIWRYWFRTLTQNSPMKNPANTSVLVLPDKLLALWEGGHPYALDLESLETLGEEDLGSLGLKQPYSAHPKRDPHTEEIFNFGVGIGLKAKLNVYKSDRSGKIIKKTAIDLDGVPVLHSFVMGGQYLVFFIPPLRLNLMPVLLGTRSFSEGLQWQPSKGTQIIVVDRDRLEVVSRGEGEPWYQWHFGNGSVDADGSVVLDLVRYRDFPRTNQHLTELPTGETHTEAKGTLWQVRLDPQTGKIREMQQACDRSCDYPTVSPQQVGQPWRYTYMALHRQGTDIVRERFDAIARFDYETGTLTEADLGDNRYPREPIYCQDAIDPNRAWVLTVVYDGNRDQSEVWIFDSDRLDEEPVCRLRLPQVIPFTFHGTWKPA